MLLQIQKGLVASVLLAYFSLTTLAYPYTDVLLVESLHYSAFIQVHVVVLSSVTIAEIYE